MSALLFVMIVSVVPVFPPSDLAAAAATPAPTYAVASCESCVEIRVNGEQVHAECASWLPSENTCWVVSGPDITPDCGAGGPCFPTQHELVMLMPLELERGQELLYDSFGSPVLLLQQCSRESMQSTLSAGMTR